MTEAFDDYVRCEGHLRKHLSLTEDNPIHKEMLSVFMVSCEEDSSEPDFGPFAVQVKRWVIRDGDLQVFLAIEKAMVTLAAVKFMPIDLTPVGITSLVMILISLLRNIYRCTAQVSPRQACILALMRKRNIPISVDDLFKEIQEPSELEWTRETITADLEGLKEIITRDGVKKMVEQLKDGRWVLNGV